MKARHVIGILILVCALFFMGPMMLISGMQFTELPDTEWWFVTVLFGVPTSALILVGTLVVGPGHRLQAAGWTLIAGACYGAFVTLIISSMVNSPEWPEMMASLQAQQGQSASTMQLESTRPLLLAALLATLGMAGLYLHHFVLNEGVEPDAQAVEQNQNGRPISVTVLSWLLIAFAGAGLLGILANPVFWDAGLVASAEVYGVSAPLLKGSSIVSLGLWLLCGVFLLRGASWARWLLVVASLAGIALNAFLYRQLWLAAPGILWLVIFVYVLFYRENAATWFRRRSITAGLEA